MIIYKSVTDYQDLYMSAQWFGGDKYKTQPSNCKYTDPYTILLLLTTKIKTRQARRYAENTRDMAVFQSHRPPELLFRKYVLDMVKGSVCTKFQVSIVFVWPGAWHQHTHIDDQT